METGPGFITPGARLAFTKLRQTFIKALILYYFDLEYYILIKTHLFKYKNGGILNQLTLNDLS